MILDLSLRNADLYAGLDLREQAGRSNLVTPPAEAIPVILRNLEAITIDRDEVVLTGSMAIWSYLVIFHWLHGRTKRIWYEDGRAERVLVAAHG